MNSAELLLLLSASLFLIGVMGIIIRKNLLVILMSVELMMNAVNLALIVFSSIHHSFSGAILTILIFTVAACEMAVAIPLILLLIKHKKTLNLEAYSDLKG